MADTELREDVIVGYITTIREFRCPTATIPRLFLKQKAAHQHTSRGTHWNFVEPGTSFVDNPPSKIYYVARTHPFSLVLLRRSLHRRDETMVIGTVPDPLALTEFNYLILISRLDEHLSTRPIPIRSETRLVASQTA